MDFITMEFYRRYFLCLNKTVDQKNKLYDCVLYKDLESENNKEKNNKENNVNKEDIKINLGSTFK